MKNNKINKYLIKSYKQMFAVIGVFTLLLLVGGTTYAFFNYTRTGGINTISVGRISFTSSQETIAFTDVFPITSEEAETDTDNAKTMSIAVSGHTDYSEGLEYLITADDVNLTVGTSPNEKTLPITLEVSVSGNGLGTEETGDYYINKNSYTTNKYKIEYNGEMNDDAHILVGYIAPNPSPAPATPAGIDGVINIKAYIDDAKVLISDTWNNGNTPTDNLGTPLSMGEGKVVFTTTEWNNITGNNALSFKIKVEANEGKWVERYVSPTAAMRKIKEDIDTTTQIDFGNISSASNGQGVYLLQGPETNNNPIYYYRGAVDNNIIFAGMCWKMVRTTETGGIKIIYNGEPIITGSGNNISYDCSNSRPSVKDGEIKSTLGLGNTNYYYADDYEVVSISNGTVTYRLKSKTNPITLVSIENSNASVSSNAPTIAANYPYTCKQTTSDATCTTLYKVDSYASAKNAYVYLTTNISSIGQGSFNSNSNNMKSVGYMYNKDYIPKSGAVDTGVYFGSGVTYENGVYTLIDATVTDEPDNSHHYTCNSTNANATCNPVRYYYALQRYIELTDGEKVEDALYKMTGNGDATVKSRTINQNYELNVTDSTIKTILESWFQKNLTNEIDNTKTDYQEYLEDTEFCYDRSYNTRGNRTLLKSGWNPNTSGISGDGDLEEGIFFGVRSRIRNDNWHSTTNRPVLTCPNETDRFSVGSTVAHLDYPIGLLTVDEVTLAGQSGNLRTVNNTYYLYTGIDWWLGSPASFLGVQGVGFVVTASGFADSSGVEVPRSFGVRPVVSLKYGIEFESGGNGTDTNPYVVKYD